MPASQLFGEMWEQHVGADKDDMCKNPAINKEEVTGFNSDGKVLVLNA